MMKLFGVFFLFSLVGLFSVQSKDEDGEYKKIEMPLTSLDDVRLSLGGEKLNHTIEKVDPLKAKYGLELIRNGQLKRKLLKSKIISPYFVCTDCHNLGREFENANDQDPASRLAYAQKNNLAFLPASTFWGIYNRTSFYNDDYIKKYGDIITKAKKSLPESIQVCAKYCAAGRTLKDWEVEAIMHYFKATELSIMDVNLTNNQIKNARLVNQLDAEEKAKLLIELEKSYVQGYSAHFDEAMPREKRKYGEGGNAETGKFIYNNACLSCHKDGRVTFLKLDSDKLSAQMFVNHMEGYSDKSAYQIIRYGTYTMAGRNQYMPRYTKDKMNDVQINDLMAYIRQLAEK